MIDESENLKQTQDYFVKYEGVTRILDILSKGGIPNKIYSSFLSLLISTLRDGNKNV